MSISRPSLPLLCGDVLPVRRVRPFPAGAISSGHGMGGKGRAVAGVLATFSPRTCCACRYGLTFGQGAECTLQRNEKERDGYVSWILRGSDTALAVPVRLHCG